MLGSVAISGTQIIVWYLGCGHQVEPDVHELVERYRAETTVLDWCERLVCSKCGGREVDMLLTGQRRQESSSQGASVEAICEKAVLISAPMFLITAAQITASSPTNKPYSTRAAPSSCE